MLYFQFKCGKIYTYIGYGWKVSTDHRWRNDLRYGGSSKLVEFIPNLPGKKCQKHSKRVFFFLICWSKFTKSSTFKLWRILWNQLMSLFLRLIKSQKVQKAWQDLHPWIFIEVEPELWFFGQKNTKHSLQSSVLLCLNHSHHCQYSYFMFHVTQKDFVSDLCINYLLIHLKIMPKFNVLK